MQLIHGDCLEKMKDIPDKSVDMVLTDPPYGTTACKWDTVIPFEPMWAELKRIIKPKGAVLLFGSEPFSSTLRMSNIKQFKYDWVWIKNRPTGCQHARNRPMSKHEHISVFSYAPMGHASLLGSNRMIYYPQGVVPTGKIKTVKEKGTHSKVGGPRPNQIGISYEAFTGFPSTVLLYDKEESHVHTSQKPVSLLEYLIKTYTLEGEAVLDFTMGSGSTGVACVNTKRNFIGIEKDEKYFEIAKKRIAGAMKDSETKLF